MAASLPTTRLGRTDMHLTRVGFGAWAIGGGDWAFAWGRQDDAQSIAAIREAVESGVNWIDTAAVYGLGHSGCPTTTCTSWRKRWASRTWTRSSRRSA
jgi:aryl-alcohol dehydrogenase-like predicted oxidoreductase